MGGRSRAVFFLLLCAPFLAAYVIPSHKVVRSWLRSAQHPPLSVGTVLPVRYNGAPGSLYLSASGQHALSAGGWVVTRGADALSGDADPQWAPLWMALDCLVLGSEEQLLQALVAAAVDLDRSGYARSVCSGDGVAVTVGSKGEGEPELPQVWFARDSWWPCRVRAAAGSGLELGAPTPSGWPRWFRFSAGELLEVAGAAHAVVVPPAWAAPAAAPAGALPSDPTFQWRRAFETPGP